MDMIVSPFATVASTADLHNLCTVNEASAAGHAYEFGFNNPHFSDRVLHIMRESCSCLGDASDAASQEATPLLSMHVNSLTLAANSEVFR